MLSRLPGFPGPVLAILASSVALLTPVAARALPATTHGLAPSTQHQRAALPSQLLFVPTNNESINIFSLQNPRTPLAQITQGLTGQQYQMTVDSAEDLFVATVGLQTQYVAVYAPPYDGPPTMLTGVRDPFGVAVDAAGTVYVSNCGQACGLTPTVYLYQNGSTTPTATITSPNFKSLGGLTLDKAGDLFIASADRSEGATTIFEVPAGSKMPQPLGLKGLVNVGNYAVPSVTLTSAGGLDVTSNADSRYVLSYRQNASVAHRIIDPFDFYDNLGIPNYGPNGVLYVPIWCAGNPCEGSVVGFGPNGNKPSVVVGQEGTFEGVATAPNINFTDRLTQTPLAYLRCARLAGVVPALGARDCATSATQRDLRADATLIASPSIGVRESPIAPASIFPKPRTHAVGHGGGWLSGAAKNGRGLVYLSTEAGSGGGAVEIYSRKGQSQEPVGSIVDGVSTPWGMDTDAHGNLFVANTGNDTVTMYAAGKTSPSATYTAGVGLTYDVNIGPDGTLYVANVVTGSGAGSVTEYAPGHTSPKLTITNGGLYATAVVADKNNNLYVAWWDASTTTEEFYEYAPGATSGTQLGLDLPAPSFPAFALAFDHAGNLVTWYESYDHSVKYLATFPPGATEPSRKIQGGSFLTIVAGINFPRSGGNVYLGVANDNEGVTLNYRSGLPLDVISLNGLTGNALSP